MQAIAMLAI